MSKWQTRGKTDKTLLKKALQKGFGRVAQHLSNMRNRMEKHCLKEQSLLTRLWGGLKSHLMGVFRDMERYSLANYGTGLTLSRDSLA